MIEKRSSEPRKEEAERRTSPENEPGKADKQPEPGAGGLSKGKYDDAVEKAAKDVQG